MKKLAIGSLVVSGLAAVAAAVAVIHQKRRMFYPSSDTAVSAIQISVLR